VPGFLLGFITPRGFLVIIPGVVVANYHVSKGDSEQKAAIFQVSIATLALRRWWPSDCIGAGQWIVYVKAGAE
jgi:hypothetical protein